MELRQLITDYPKLKNAYSFLENKIGDGYSGIFKPNIIADNYDALVAENPNSALFEFAEVVNAANNAFQANTKLN